MVGVFLHVCFHKRPSFLRGNVEPGISGSLRCRKTDEELCIRVGTSIDNIDPSIEVELASAFDPVSSGATPGVVPLDPNEIKPGFGDSVTELNIWESALGSTGDVELPGRGEREVPTKTINHSGISYKNLLGKNIERFRLWRTYRLHHYTQYRSRIHRQRHQAMGEGMRWWPIPGSKTRKRSRDCKDQRNAIRSLQTSVR